MSPRPCSAADVPSTDSAGLLTQVADFNRVARAYRWLEYLSLGHALEHMRFAHLDAGSLDRCRSALVLGDGDGRFTARLMRRNDAVEVTAVDASVQMLNLLAQRCAPFENRLQTWHGDARRYRPDTACDLVVSHFFLDCLTEPEVADLIARLRPALEPRALWLVSEFRETTWWTRGIVRGLYLAFRLLTGLKVRRIPAYAAILSQAGFTREAQVESLGGLLRTELWRLQP